MNGKNKRKAENYFSVTKFIIHDRMPVFDFLLLAVVPGILLALNDIFPERAYETRYD